MKEIEFKQFLLSFDIEYDLLLRHEEAEKILNEGLSSLQLSIIDQIAARRCLAVIYDVSKADWQKGISFLQENQKLLSKYEKDLLDQACKIHLPSEDRCYIIKNIARHYDIYGRLQFRMMLYLQAIDMFEKSLSIIHKFSEKCIQCISADVQSNSIRSQYQVTVFSLASEDEFSEADEVRKSNLNRKIRFIIYYLDAIKKVSGLEHDIDQNTTDWRELQRGKSSLLHNLAIACRTLGGLNIPQALTEIPQDLLQVLSKESRYTISSSLERLDLVISLHNKALEINDLLHDDYRKAQTLLNKAIALLDTKRYKEAQFILKEIISKSGWIRGHWIAHEKLAKLADIEKNTQEIIKHIAAVEEDKQSISDVETMLYLKTTKANRLKEEYPKESYKIFKEIVETGETIRKRFGFPHYRRRIINHYMRAIEEIVGFSFSEGKVEEALQYVERRASRELLDLYILSSSGKNTEAFIPPQDIMEKISKTRISIGRLLDLSLRDSIRSIRSSDFLYYLPAEEQNDFFSLTGQLDFLYEERWEANKRYRDITHSQAKVAAVTDIVSILDEDTVIVQYFIPQNSSIGYGYVIVISAHGIHITHSIQITQNLQSYINSQEPWTYECLTTLYSLLFSPIKDEVDSLKPKRLCFVADGSLAKFPLNCLYDKDSKKFLWEIYIDTCFTQTPSATIFGVIKQNVNKGVERQFSEKILVVADSKVDEKGEALAISKVFEKEAHIVESDKLSSMDLSKALNHANVQTFHFIGHGMFLEMAPMLGLLYLGNREFLTAADLFSTQIEQSGSSGPQLVFLNSCQTGKTTPRYNEMLGLIRSFLLLGASTVIATLWNVNSSDATYFSTNFYTNLKQTNSPCEAFKYATRLQSDNIALRTHRKLGYCFPYVLYGLGEKLV